MTIRAASGYFLVEKFTPEPKEIESRSRHIIVGGKLSSPITFGCDWTGIVYFFEEDAITLNEKTNMYLVKQSAVIAYDSP
jgi:hypothetical protein